MSTLPVLQTPVTCAPSALAICTANVPTPPEAPMTSTLWPAWTCPLSRRACHGVLGEGRGPRGWPAGAEDRIPCLQSGDPGSDLLDHARDVRAEARMLG